MTTAAILFNLLDLPDDQRLLVVLGMMQILPEAFDD
jgi:hypothetical protein